VQKSRPTSHVKVKGQDHQGQKTKKIAESSSVTIHYNARAVGRTQQAATDDTEGIMTSQQA